MIWRLLILVPLGWALGFALFLVSLGRPLDNHRTDAVVVLTGGPGRIDRGLEALRGGDARRMLVSGVDPDVKPRELAAQFKIDSRLMDCCIDLGWQAVDTRSNAEETAAWVKRNRFRSVRLVTTDWHMPRARMELSAALDGDVKVLGDGVRGPTGLPGYGVLIREYHKYLIRRVALWTGAG